MPSTGELLWHRKARSRAQFSVWFRPRVLRDVTNVDFSTNILGFPSSMPVYITATALGKFSNVI